MKYFYLLFIGLFSQLAFAQSTVTAIVMDEENDPIVAANVLILQPSDSSLIKGELILDGVLRIEISEGTYILKISSLGYENHFQVLTVGTRDMNLGNITLTTATNQLETIEVKAKASQPFQMEGGVLNVNVENSALSSAGTALDVLRSTPGVLIGNNESVEIFGKGQARIFLDGQEIDDPNIVQSLNSDDIKSIKVMRNPSAKYDAQGKGGVIEIITKNASLEGALYTIRGNITKAEYWRGFLGANMSYRKGPFDLFVSLDNNPYKVYEKEDYQRNVNSSEGPIQLINDVQVDYGSLLSSNYNVKAGYKINNSNTVRLGYRGRYQDRNNERSNLNNVSIRDSLTNTLLSETEEDERYQYNIVDGKYIFSDSAGNTINLNLSNTAYRYNDQDDIEEMLSGGRSFIRRGEGENDINIFIGKLDYERPLFHKFLTSEWGIKYSQTTNTSENQFFNNQNGEWIPDNDLKNTLDYKEDNYAAYGNLKKQWGPWTFTAGLRYEGTNAEATSFQSGNYLDTTYNLLFKSGNVEYAFNDDIRLNLAYTERIQRPSFQDLDPFIEYVDSFSILKGNATLRPELVQNLEFTGSYSGYPLLTLGYTYTQDPITLVVEKDVQNEAINVGIERNLEYARSLNGQIILPYQNDWWTSANGFGWTRNTVSFNEFNGGEDFTKDQYFIFSNQDFNFSNGWSTGALFVWFSPGVDGIFEFRAGSFLNLWLGKKWGDGKWQARISANDIFRKNIARSFTTLGDLNLQFQGYYDSQRVRAELTYKFGKLKSSTKGDNDSSDEFDRIKF